MNPEDQAKFDQHLALAADFLPGFWRRLYENCVIAGFTLDQALLLVRTYIVAHGNSPHAPER